MSDGHAADGFAHVYVHVPFCRAKCPYCDFYSVVGAGASEAFVRAVADEARSCRELGVVGGVDTLYVGGGTPTVLGADLTTLVEVVADAVGPLRGAEVTVEANPESTTAESMRDLRDAGVTRVSVGVQSFDDSVLETLGRSHDAEAARRAVEDVLVAGLDVSVDLICGVPGQSLESWRASLARSVSGGVGHVSVYPLTVEPDTPMGSAVARGSVDAPDPDLAAEMMVAADEVLAADGFARYEVANHARPGMRARHNLAYWTGASYLGLGPAAHGMCGSRTARVLLAGRGAGEPGGRVRFAHARDVDAYVEDPLGSVSEIEYLSPRSAAVEDVMLGLRLTAGVAAETAHALGLQDVLGSLGEDGLVERSSGVWRTTRKGWLLGNEVYGRVWDAR